MKHLTKFALSAIVCLLAMSSFAQTETITPDTRWRYDGTSSFADRHNPLNYTSVVAAPTSCNRTATPWSSICYLALKNSELYTQADIDANPNDVIVQSWFGLPRVHSGAGTNANGASGTLDDDVDTIIGMSSDITGGTKYNVFGKD